jgi:hypothetical protein
MNFSPLFIVALGAAFIFWLNRLHIRNLFQAFVKSPVRKSSQAKLSDSVSRLALAASRNDFIEFAATLEDGGENLALEYMVTGPPSLEFLQELTVRYPLNALASYLLGCRLLAEAWKSRAGKRVSQTKQDRKSCFQSRLQEADVALARAHSIDPGLRIVYQPLLSVCMGQEQKARAVTLYDQARQAAPDLIDFKGTMLNLLSEKWLGSDVEMFTFAKFQSVATRNPLDKALIPLAHVEIWSGLEGKEAKQYFKQRQVVKEIVDAYDAFCHLPVPLHYVGRRQKALAENCFALCFMHTDDKERLARLLVSIDSSVTVFPWRYLGVQQPIDMINTLRLRVGLELL